ncbi:Trophozoite antigen GTA-1 [Aduncisulcus paluster]|uniref:Trophozoite antigen GTA-1 n=1 Tax=Aduncisulcus paluster TaxID=2918883 RepID=A0ABQ5JUM9_9EUKA|nr:Trophozoite antigen GTA-1 [Aduncisulcus paluster]
MEVSLTKNRINPVAQWTRNDVSVWLSAIRLKSYAESFRAANICGRSLIMLTEEDLRCLGVDSLGDRKALVWEIDRLKLWTGFVWRGEIKVDSIVTSAELLLSLEPDRMYAMCSVHNAPVSGIDLPPERLKLQVKWTFLQKVPDAQMAKEHFSTIAEYSPQQCRSIIRLPCQIEDVGVEIVTPSDDADM